MSHMTVRLHLTLLDNSPVTEVVITSACEHNQYVTPILGEGQAAFTRLMQPELKCSVLPTSLINGRRRRTPLVDCLSPPAIAPVPEALQSPDDRD